MRRVAITDARGRRARLCEPSDLPAGASDDLQLLVGNANRHRPRPLISAVLIASLLVIAAFVTAWAVPAALSDSMMFLTVIVVPAAVALFFLYLVSNWALARFTWGEPARDACLLEAICPSCAYSLAGSLPEPDGCSVCPECGSAWRVVPASSAR